MHYVSEFPHYDRFTMMCVCRQKVLISHLSTCRTSDALRHDKVKQVCDLTEAVCRNCSFIKLREQMDWFVDK